jgi:hypothetical protein
MRFEWSRGPSGWCGTLLRALHVEALASVFWPSGGCSADDVRCRRGRRALERAGVQLLGPSMV